MLPAAGGKRKERKEGGKEGNGLHMNAHIPLCGGKHTTGQEHVCVAGEKVGERAEGRLSRSA